MNTNRPIFSKITRIVAILSIPVLLLIATHTQTFSQSVETTDTESASAQTYIGKLRPINCVNNSGNQIRLCYKLNASDGKVLYITGASDKINADIARYVNTDVKITGLWIKVGSPYFFLVRNFLSEAGPTATPRPRP